MAIPLAPAVVAVISVVGVGIFKVVEGDHDVSSFLIFSSPTPLPPPPRGTPPRSIIASDHTGLSSGHAVGLTRFILRRIGNRWCRKAPRAPLVQISVEVTC